MFFSFLFFSKFSSSLCFLLISICSLMLLCVYVGVTDQSGIVWSTFAVCSFEFPPCFSSSLMVYSYACEKLDS